VYLSATMTIDPSQLTQLRRKPTKGFRRFAEMLTLNLLSEREEHETFTALSILQEINVVLRSIGVVDVVMFSKDDSVLYDDRESKYPDDFPSTIDALKQQHTTGHEPFSSLSLLLEHNLPSLVTVIEIRIRRVHAVGVYPIQVSINALDAELQSTEDSAAINDRLEQVFESQQSYDSYTHSRKVEFEEFVDAMEQAFRSRMRIDNLHRRVDTNVVRPGLTGSPSTLSAGSDDTPTSAPMFQRYDNTDSMMYLWMWSNMMHSNNTHCNNTTIVTERGVPAFQVGEKGFNAGESNTLDAEAPFEKPDCPIEPVERVEGVSSETVHEADFGLLGGDSSDSNRSSWFDSFSFSDTTGSSSGADPGDAGGDSGGASCGSSSGSSCGSGCGGGCSS
jgi:hypothetical protein